MQGTMVSLASMASWVGFMTALLESKKEHLKMYLWLFLNKSDKKSWVGFSKKERQKNTRERKKETQMLKEYMQLLNKKKIILF